MAGSSPVLFEDYALDVGRRELRRGGELVALGPQVFDLLVHLVSHRDQVVTKDDMLQAVWNGRIVSESTLTSCINAVRKALGDSGESQRLIRTIHRKGIRFVGEVRSTTAEPARLAPLPEMAARSNAAPGPAEPPAIAVLPFANMGGDPDQEYFADGITEDITTALSRFKSLFVIARNSSFTFKGKVVDIKQVGRDLGVRYAVEGSVRRAGERVRITGQLIDCESSAHLWADRFDGSLEDVFDFQDRVAASVVGAVAPKLDQAERERAKRKPVENLDAYDCYLRGMASLYEHTRESLDKALRLFYRAIELAPGFATPYAMAARCYADSKSMSWIIDKENEEAEVRRLALHVSNLGRDDALALSWAGFSMAWVCREYDSGAALADEALAINQNLAIGWINRGFISLYLGQHDAAIEQLLRGARLSPIDPESNRSAAAIAFAHLLQGHFDDALTWAARAVTLRPNTIPGWAASALANAFAGNIGDARESVARILQLNARFRISILHDAVPFRRPQDMDRVMEGFRLAGLPE